MPPEGYDYDTHSRIAGPLTQPSGAAYRVGYRSLLAAEPRRVRAALLMTLAPVLTGALLCYLVWPSHWTHREGAPAWLGRLDTVMLASIGLIELFMLVNVVSIAHATMVARDPVPVVPEAGTRVAFLTTYVPGKEPLAMVRATLAAAVRVRHTGPKDVWLLDEGDDAAAKELCAELGVRHFTRRGVAAWNQERGPHKARTKHGNYNAWLAMHGGDYAYLASVDTDHVPHPAFLERMMGYFRDPDVAFVVGPQVYGNYDSPVTKAAESQQFLFHALIQRAGNRYRSPMFVGTNNVVRIAALRQIHGLYDSITEDMATGFELHRHRNPGTGRRWTSVYTPDVLAVGEGPASWTDFFTQQMRWSRGTYETLFRQYWRAPFSMPPGRLLSYTLMLVYYPMTAVNWVLGILSSVLFLWFGASGTQVSASVWLMLYSDAAALQIALYLWNRRHNVSPHEPRGSGGLAGMAMSALSAPVYARSLGAALLRRPCRFVVTPKGATASADRPATFRIHLFWAAVLTVSLTASALLGHTHAAMRTWALLALAICLAPVVVWGWTGRRGRAVPPLPAAHAASGAAARAATAPSEAVRPAPREAAPRGPGELPGGVPGESARPAPAKASRTVPAEQAPAGPPGRAVPAGSGAAAPGATAGAAGGALPEALSGEIVETGPGEAARTLPAGLTRVAPGGTAPRAAGRAGPVGSPSGTAGG